MAIVTKGAAVPRGGNIVGMISKEHIADSVADSMRPYSTELEGPI